MSPKARDRLRRMQKTAQQTSYDEKKISAAYMFPIGKDAFSVMTSDEANTENMRPNERLSTTPLQAVPNSSGQPLDKDITDYMEPRFGHDFSQVRVHTDERAAASASSVNANAYTVGQDIVFGSGQYTPDTPNGRHRLAHELAHVVQQSRGGSHTPPPILNHPLEKAAEQSASTVISGGTTSVTGASAPGIARQPRSLSENLNPTLMSDAELQQEITLIRQWLAENPEGGDAYNQLTEALSPLEAEVYQRTQQQSSTNQTQSQPDQQQNAPPPAPTDTATPQSSDSGGDGAANDGNATATTATSADQQVSLPMNPPEPQQIPAQQALTPQPFAANVSVSSSGTGGQKKAGTTASPQQSSSDATQQATPPASASSTPLLSTVPHDPVQFGLDLSADYTANFQLSFVARHMDALRFQAFRQGPFDFVHEPTATIGYSLDPRLSNTFMAQGSITALNMHIQRHGQDFIELGLGQLGIGIDQHGNVTMGAGVQAELHSPNPHFSIVITAGGSHSYDSNSREWRTTWGLPIFQIMCHPLNP